MIRRTTKLALPALLLGLASGLASPVRAADPDFVVWPAYNVRFDSEPTGIVLLAAVYVLNPKSHDLRDLRLVSAAPEGFTISMPPKEIQEASRRPRGFTEEIAENTYRMTQPYLGAGQATTIFYELRWSSPPADFVEFPGIRIEYRVGEQAQLFEAASESNSLSRLRRFSGGLTDYIKRHARVTFDLERGPDSPEWSFTALDYRAFGRNPIGIIDIEGLPEGSGHFRVQAGYPGSFREILFRWEPRSRGRKDPITDEFAREATDTMIRWVGDFRVEKESLQASDVEVARYPAVLVQGRWVDNQPVRLGSGLFRLYVLNDPRSDRDMYIYLGVQARGIGPGNADKPAPEKEVALMETLIPYVDKFRP